MQIGPDGFFHLTYCTKVHPTNGWEELFAHIRSCVPALKARLSPTRPFGLGLRLSEAESRERIRRVLMALRHDDLPGSLVVVDRKSIRRRPLPA